jgi:putative transposon-encoded protein
MTGKDIKISIDISIMRKLDLKPSEMSLSEEVELIFEKRVTPFGTSAKLDVPKKYRGWRAYVIIVKD